MEEVGEGALLGWGWRGQVLILSAVSARFSIDTLQTPYVIQMKIGEATHPPSSDVFAQEAYYASLPNLDHRFRQTKLAMRSEDLRRL
jgi:hypothetical protein